MSVSKVPILFIIFNRKDTAERTFAAIKEYQPTQLFIASDGPRIDKPGEKELVEDLKRFILSKIDWTCEVKTLYRQSNLGCGVGVSSAITWFFGQVEYGIILEDDCMPNQTFFHYCEELLLKYRYEESIKLIGGNNFQNGIQRGNASYYYSRYPTTWGWASWKRVWKDFDHDILEVDIDSLAVIFNSKAELAHWVKVLKSANDDKSHIWDFHFYYSIWKAKGMCITPNKNLVVNIGFDNNGTHYFLKDPIRSGMRSENLNAPLLHPDKIEVDRLADSYTYNHFYSHSIKRGLKLLKSNDLSSIYRYLLYKWKRKN